MTSNFPEKITMAERKLAGCCPMCGSDTPLVRKQYHAVDHEGKGPADLPYRYCKECASWEWI